MTWDKEQVAWDEGQVKDKALGFGVTWALRHCDNNGCRDCGVTWPLLTSLEKIHKEKKKQSKAENIKLNMQ